MAASPTSLRSDGSDVPIDHAHHRLRMPGLAPAGRHRYRGQRKPTSHIAHGVDIVNVRVLELIHWDKAVPVSLHPGCL